MEASLPSTLDVMTKKLEPHPHSVLRGALYLSFAWLFTTAIGIFAHLTCQEAGVWMMFLTVNIVSLILVLPMMNRSSFHMHAWGPLAVRIICAAFGFICMFMAIKKKTMLVDVILLNNTAPIFLPFVMMLWLKMRLNPRVWWGILVGFLGVLFVLKPSKSLFLESGLFYALGTGVFYAISMVALRLLGKREKSLNILFYFFFFLSIIALAPAILTWKRLSLRCMVELMSLGLCSYLSQVCYLKAFTHAKPIEINPINYTGVVFSAVAGWLIWAEKLDWLGACGILLIIFGSGLTLYLDKRLQ